MNEKGGMFKTTSFFDLNSEFFRHRVILMPGEESHLPEESLRALPGLASWLPDARVGDLFYMRGIVIITNND